MTETIGQGDDGVFSAIHPWQGEEFPALLSQNRSGGRTPHEEGNTMADLIVIGYPDETTADAAADEARRWPPT